MELNLDKARAARAQDAHQLVFGGATFDLPPEMSVLAGEMFAEGDVRGAISELLNGQAEKFFELGPTVNDLDALVSGVEVTNDDGTTTKLPGLTDLYVPGTPVGESSASSASSKALTKSRQPSSANTDST